MVLSKRQKILAVALGAAAAVFIADRILVGLDDIGPAEARAWQTGDLDLAPLVPKGLLPAAPVSEVTTHSEATLADRLEQAAENNELESTTVKDAFCPSGSWSGMDTTERAPLGSVEATAAAFSERHRLTATAVGGQGGMAIIDGQCLAVGREIDGFRLVSVIRNSAALACAGVEVTLTLSNETSRTAKD